jgi:GLPGLI family protein
MKQILRYMIFILPLWPSVSLRAQKVLSEGFIQYDVSVQTGSSQAKMADAFDGATAFVYVKGSQSRTELKSAIGNSITIYDSKAGTGVVIREFGAQKLLIRMNAKNWSDKNKKYEGISFTNTAETKKIAGFNCQQATAKLADGSVFTVFYTNELVMENREYDAQFRNLPGIPLEYESVLGNLRVRYSASRVSFDPIPYQRFEIPTSGYREMTYEESMKAVSSN